MATKKETAGKTAKKEENKVENKDIQVEAKAFAVPKEVGVYIEHLKTDIKFATTVLSIVRGGLQDENRTEEITRQLFELVRGFTDHMISQHGISKIEIMGLTCMIAKDLMPMIREGVKEKMADEAKAAKAAAKKSEKKGGK